MFDCKQFGENLKRHRIQRNLTRQSLCDISNISYRSLENIEKGNQVPTIKTIVNILNSFQLNYSSFMENNMDKSEGNYDIKEEIISKLDHFTHEEKLYILKLSEAIDTFNKELNEVCNSV